MELFSKIRNEARAAVEASGGTYTPHPAEAVVDTMVELGRPGRLRGAGFYEYDEQGKRTSLWPGLAEHFPVRGNPAEVDLDELKERMLFVEAVDSARCMEEGVLITAADANIGSIMGIGFPPWTGGVLQYINGYPGGVAGFVARADELAAKYGDRFAPNPPLRKKAENGEPF
jgi:3-hydroxyacyl-CoA dehydrogenase/enoyl-CoA hydratase/3-hydroxybutyryl-CoA epimerase